MAAISSSDPQFEVYKQRLFDEVAKGNLVMIKALAKKNPALLNCVTNRRCTALHWAAAHSRLDVVEWLLSDEGRAAGFKSVLSKVERGWTALYLSSNKGDLETCKAIANGCKVENGEREHMMNAVDDLGHTLLHIAASQEKLPIVRWLLSDKKGGGREAGFHSVLAAETYSGMTALHMAIGKGNIECFTAIVEGCKAENGERKGLLNAVMNVGITVLILAAQHGDLPIIKWLLSKGRDHGFTSIFARTKRGLTALHEAAAHGHLEACKAIVEGCKVENGERIQMLNAVDDGGLTVLHYAAARGRTSVVNWLLSDKPGGGRTLGFYSVLAITKDQLLTALHLAAEEGHLETCKAIVNGCKVENDERDVMLNDTDKLGLTALLYALRLGRSDIVTWLLSTDANGGRARGLKSETIIEMDSNSYSPLHFAAFSASVETVRALLSRCTVGERLKMFLTVDKHGWTPLHHAARFHRPDIIRELLLHHEETNMIVDHRDHRGMTALHRVILDGGVDEESKEEWKLGVNPDDPNLAPREEVVAALLTYEINEEEEEEGGGKGQAAASTKKGNKKKKQQRQQQQRHEQEQQAAFIDVNLGLKIEEKRE